MGLTKRIEFSYFWTSIFIIVLLISSYALFSEPSGGSLINLPDKAMHFFLFLTLSFLLNKSNDYFKTSLFFIIFWSGKAPKGHGRHLKGFLEGVASSSQSMGPWGATATPFTPIFIISGHRFCVSTVRCQPKKNNFLNENFVFIELTTT